MPTPTTNLNLLKPSVGESYNVQLLDDNYDKIDAASVASKIQHFEATYLITPTAANADTGLGTAAAMLAGRDASNSINDAGLLSFPATNIIQLTKAGIYAIQWKAVPFAAVTSSLRVLDGGASTEYGVTPGDLNGVATPNGGGLFLNIPNLYLPANAQILPYFRCNSATQHSLRIRISKLVS